MSYFIVLQKILENTVFVVYSAFPAMVGNKTKVHVLPLDILEIIAQLGPQCGLG